MAPLIVLALFAASQAAGPPPATVEKLRPYIAAAARRFDLPPDWITAVIRTESGARVALEGHPIRSPAGAMGLMQLMPATWQDMRAMLHLGTDPDDPNDNILAGSAYLRLMFDRFGYPGLFAAYNAGPGRYAAYLGNGTPLPRETGAYLASITSVTMEAPLSEKAPDSLFVATGMQSAAGLHPPEAGRSSLFVYLASSIGTP